MLIQIGCNAIYSHIGMNIFIKNNTNDFCLIFCNFQFSI